MKISCCLLLLITLHTAAQQPAAETQLKHIESLPSDTATVNQLNALAAENFASDPVFARDVSNKAIKLSEKINYPLGGSAAYGSQASLLIYEMKLDSALLLLNKAFDLVKDNKLPVFINQQANLNNKYGAVLQQQQLYDSAIKKYLLSADLYKQTNNEKLAIVGYYNISVMYGLMNEPERSLYYARQVQRIATVTANPEFLIRSYIALGDAFTAAKQYDSLLYYVQQGSEAAKPSNPFVAGKLYQQMGIYNLNAKKDYPAALHYFDSSLAAFEKINLPYEKALVLQNIGNTYLQQKDYGNAVKYATKAAELCRQFGMNDLLLKSMGDLASAAENGGDIGKAYEYMKAYLTLKDTLDLRNKSKQVNEIEAKYQSKNKEAQLLAQQNIIGKKSMLNYVLTGGGVTLLVISFLLLRNYRQQQQLQQQRINELETDKKLTATGAVLKGEEQERTRLAKDLHDGLGGMLSGIKFSFQNIKGNLVMTQENAYAFEKSIEMLDSSIKEMRRVAHNLMPEALVEFGLDTALKDFCNDINQTGALAISYQSIGLQDATIDQTTAITIYRVVQELISNTVKHAKATRAIVQVSKTEERLAITVEDDGNGFDTAILNNLKERLAGAAAKGIGWSNITSRIDLLKGTVDVQSTPEKGTSVHIELNIA